MEASRPRGAARDQECATSGGSPRPPACPARGQGTSGTNIACAMVDSESSRESNIPTSSGGAGSSRGGDAQQSLGRAALEPSVPKRKISLQEYMAKNPAKMSLKQYLDQIKAKGEGGN